MHRTNTGNDCEFLFAALAEKHNAVAEIIKAIVHEHEQTRQMIKETNGLVQKVLSAIAKTLPFLRDRHRYKVPVRVAAAVSYHSGYVGGRVDGATEVAK